MNTCMYMYVMRQAYTLLPSACVRMEWLVVLCVCCHGIGEDAVKFEGLPDDVVVAKAVAVLRSIFGDRNVPEVSLKWWCDFCRLPKLLYMHMYRARASVSNTRVHVHVY